MWPLGMVGEPVTGALVGVVACAAGRSHEQGSVDSHQVVGGGGEMELAGCLVPGVSEHGADQVLGSARHIIASRGRGLHHRHQALHIAEGLSEARCDDNVVARDRHLCVVALQKAFAGRYDS
jgi:hypothetical protein